MGPTAEDYLLGGLAGSMLTTFITEASIRSLEINSLSLEIDGKLCLQAIHGVKKKSNSGFEKLEYKFYIDSKAEISILYEIADHVIFYSPIYATISRGSVELIRDFEIT
ncbi:MAG: OsmC family protein [Cellulophaga sp.]